MPEYVATRARNERHYSQWRFSPLLGTVSAWSDRQSRQRGSGQPKLDLNGQISYSYL
jgi:hypothetical protein